MTFKQLLSRWPSKAAIAADLGLPYDTVAAWSRRNSVPASRWKELAAAADQRGIEDATIQHFVEAASNKGGGVLA